MKKHGRTSQWLITAVLLIILCVCWLGILRINFSKNPSYYCTDMYSDMMYAVEVWNQKTIFPEGWVFGNQLYVMATPVMAALCYGITKDPCIAMGLASTLMGIGMLVSFYWMLKPMFGRFSERLLAVVCFMAVTLFAGDPVFSINGWQLFFTMCSYYACYAFTVFLVFGCYLRSEMNWNPGFVLILSVTCALSFVTGMQSLRQTAIMILPLLAVEILKILHSNIVKRKYTYRATFLVGILSFFNLAGVVYVKQIAIEKNEIFGLTSLRISPHLLKTMKTSATIPFELFSCLCYAAMLLFCVVCIFLFVAVFRKKDWENDGVFLCALLCIVNVAVVWGVDVFTTMTIRAKYYFLLYPMAAIGAAWLYSKSRQSFRALAVAIVVLLFLCCGQELFPYFAEESDPFQQIGDCLEENGVTTVYSYWDLGEKVAIASDFRIQAGFWASRREPFQSVKYLCNPSVFDADITQCAYLVRGQEVFERTREAAEKQGASVQEMEYFPELDAYLFTADVRLMQ